MAEQSGSNDGERTPPRIPIPGVSSDSPAASPRDKRQRTESETSQESPRGRSHSGGAFPITVAASPPKFVSMEEIMKAAQGVSNLALAHEIAVDSDFSINPVDAPKDSLETKVKDAMHKAFWDILQEKLNEDPPDLSHAVILLSEVKENLMHLLLPQHVTIRQQINEVLDMELVEQKAEHGALDFHYYASFVIDLMSKLCAEARDEEVAKLRAIKEIVPLYREVFRVLDLLKLDMANFTIQQMRPFIQQQSAQYERAKFDNFLKQQRDNNVDGLQFTKAWLDRNKIVLEKRQEEAKSTEGSTASAGTTPKIVISPTAILNEAYLELLQWDFDNQLFPETVLLDEARFITLAQRVKWLSLVSSTLLVTYNSVGAPLVGIGGFKDKLKEQMAAIMAGVPESQLGEGMKNVAVQVLKEVQECLQKHGFPQLDSARSDALSKQIEALADPQHPVQKLMRSRIIGFIRTVLSRSQPQQSLQLPPGLSTVSTELSETCSAFMRLVTHNQKVFGSHYADIIKPLIDTAQ